MSKNYATRIICILIAPLSGLNSLKEISLNTVKTSVNNLSCQAH